MFFIFSSGPGKSDGAFSRLPGHGSGYLVAGLLIATLAGFNQPLKAKITVVSYILRDRAVVLDSLVMRKRMYFSFKTSLPVEKTKGSAVVGTLSNGGKALAQDTTYIFDEAGGNLGFGLPYEIPDGTYRLTIRQISGKGVELDRYTGDFPREELRAYFKRTISFWDFTMPYGHLACSGYGYLAYRFKSAKPVKCKAVEVSARMRSGSEYPVKVRLFLNDVALGEFELPSGGSRTRSVVTWRADDPGKLSGLTVKPGDNHLRLEIPREINPQGMGIRIDAIKNSTDPAVEPAVPITLRITPENSGGEDVVFRVPVWGTDGEHITSDFAVPAPTSFTRKTIRTDQEPLPLNQEDIRKGYVIFQKNYMRYVYPWTIPADSERVTSLGLRMSRNDFEPLTFSLYPVRELGKVKVSVSDLIGPGGKAIPSANVQVYVVKTIKMREGSSYRLVPRLLDRTDYAFIPIDYTTRFWLTVHAGSSQSPGSYKGIIRVQPEKERPSELPLAVEVLPITLEPVPDITYSMFMSYEFFELESKDWTAAQREKIYQDGLSVFRDFKNHGLNSVDVASPYYFQWNRDGTPRMEHYRAMIKAARETGFTGPLYWYFAHYVQAAKKQHPGSVLTYDPRVHPGRARYLVKSALKIAEELDGPPVHFVPIDEPRIASRQKIALELLKAIKKVPGVVSMSSTDIGGKLLDIENNNESFSKRLAPGEKVRTAERKVWEYNNTAVQCFNPGYSRYIYGYYTWRQDLDGMNSWCFNTAENSRGNPYEALDHQYNDWNLAFPHAGGPLPSTNWESLREGIEDVRYVYQLEKLIREKAARHPGRAAEADKFLDRIRSRCDIDDREMINDFGDWSPEAYDSVRSDLISWILRMQEL